MCNLILTMEFIKELTWLLGWVIKCVSLHLLQRLSILLFQEAYFKRKLLFQSKRIRSCLSKFFSNKCIKKLFVLKLILLHTAIDYTFQFYCLPVKPF